MKAIFLEHFFLKHTHLRSHPQGPLEDTPDVTGTVYVSEFLSLWGWRGSLGYLPRVFLGKIIDHTETLKSESSYTLSPGLVWCLRKIFVSFGWIHFACCFLLPQKKIIFCHFWDGNLRSKVPKDWCQRLRWLKKKHVLSEVKFSPTNQRGKCGAAVDSADLWGLDQWLCHRILEKHHWRVRYQSRTPRESLWPVWLWIFRRRSWKVLHENCQ